MSKINIYQIYYDSETRQRVMQQSDYIPLNNCQTDRAAWYEFGAIKSFFDTTVIDDESIYGFISPKFFEKTGITAEELYQTIQTYQATTDVFLVGVLWGQLTFFQNPFEQGDVWHPNLSVLSQEVVNRLNWGLDLNNLVTSSHNFAFCNYVFAKASYWRQWKHYADALFEFVENDDSELGEALRGPTTYNGGESAMRTFVQERLLPVMVMTQNTFRTKPISIHTENHPIFGIGQMFINHFGSMEKARSVLHVCDALKTQYLRDGNPEHLKCFHHIRHHLKQSSNI